MATPAELARDLPITYSMQVRYRGGHEDIMSLDAADEMEARNRAAATLYRSEVVSVHLFEDLGGELVEVPVTGIVRVERYNYPGDPICCPETEFEAEEAY